MEQTVITKKDGFTLVEIMVSFLLLTIVILGILQIMAVYSKINVKNTIRDEAIKVAQECIEDLRNGVNCPSNIIREFRNFSILYTISAPSVSSFTSGNNPVQITITYSYPSSNSTQNITLNSVIHRP